MATFQTSIIPDPKDPSQPLKTPNGQTIRRPLLKVELLGSDGDALFETRALVDSGADTTMVNAEFALALGIDLSTEKEIDVKGIYAEPIKGRASHIRLRLVDLNVEMTLPAIFVYSGNVNVLLGREAFFQQYNVRFCIAKNRFEIKKPR